MLRKAPAGKGYVALTYTAVTLEGTVIHKTGMITGGPSMQDTVQLWDEQEMVGAQRERDRCMSELKELQQQKYALGDEDELVAEVTRAQSAVQAVRHERAEVERRGDNVQRETDALQKQQGALAERVEALQAQCAHTQEARAAVQRKIDAIDDELFAPFCGHIGVTNVREYESNQLQLTQALDVATQQHQRQLARLAHQQAFSKDQLKGTADRLAFIQATMDKENGRLPALEEQLVACDDAMAEIRSSMDAAKASLAELREQHAQQSEVLAEKRKALATSTRDVEAHQREVAERSDEMAQLDAERTDLYRRCRLEALDLPLEAGDLAQVPLEEDTALAMEPVQDLHAARDYGLVVDFSSLSDAERTDRGSGKGRELQEKIDAARDEMEQLAPSTHMGEKLTALERDLKACEREMDACRELVRDTRDEFQGLKKKRTDLFLRAYHHIAERIDGVYKELTRSKAAPAGGVAYLTLDETDVCCATDHRNRSAQAFGTMPCRRSSAFAIWTSYRVARRPWQHSRSSLPSTRSSRRRSLCWTRWMPRSTRTMWRRSANTSARMRVSSSNSLLFRSRYVHGTYAGLSLRAQPGACWRVP